MKKLTDTERRIQSLEYDVRDLREMAIMILHRIDDLEKPRALTKQEILDAGGVISLGGR